MSRPNILLITTDQQRWDTLGCYGAPGAHTPNLDRLAAEGTLFEQCYCTNPICTPSRSSMWTGLHLPGHGVYRVHDILPDDKVLFSRRLRDAGYDTALFGKLHVSGHMWEAERRHPNDGFRVYEWAPDPPGFLGADTAYLTWLQQRHPEVRERFRQRGANPGHLPIEAHFTTWVAERTIAFLEQMREPGKPFFCCMGIFDPHDPYGNHPKEMERLINIEKLAPAVAVDEPFEGRPESHRRHRDCCYLGPASEFTPQRVAEFRRGYHAAVALVDMQVGRVLDALEGLGMADDTLVIFASDHGDMLGDHGLMVKGGFFYDGSTRVPLIVRGPGAERGRRVKALAQLHDIAATALRASGAPAEAVREGAPDSVDLRDEQALRRRGYAACLYRNSIICADHVTRTKGYFDPPILATMWREGAYKLNVYHSAPEGTPRGELFHMDEDPHELRNLWNDASARAIRDRMTQRLDEWLAAQDYRAVAQRPGAMPSGASYFGVGRADSRG
ncbi:MAG TPA: sulfatase-like hydrolase/transferase [Candidatus Brocadiia bacterium]|nr:sulfatase-like hydrolase/transferase [Candidatus Brocadiia bacterium]